MKKQTKNILIKKSYWIYPAQSKKIKKLSKKSESAVIRDMIDSI